jgi:rare lipoprotein A
MAVKSSALSRFLVAGMACLLVTGCASSFKNGKKANKYGVAASPRVVNDMGPIDPAVKHRGMAMVGAPYTVAGRVYVPKDDPEYKAVGTASWYGEDFHGRLTANGEVYDMHDLSAAHATMPLPSYARVTNLGNGRSLVVRVNDRGPYHEGRVIDVSSRAAELLDFRRDGVGRVKVEYLGRASTRSSDTEMLLATLRTDGSAAPVPGSAPPVMVAQAPLPPVRASDAVVQASFAPVADLPVTTASSAGQPDHSLDLGTFTTIELPVPRPPLERQAALQSGALKVADIVGQSDGQVMAFASLAPAPRSIFVNGGVYADRDNAERLAARLSAGAPTSVDPVAVGERKLWRVKAGPYRSVEAATIAREIAREAGAAGADLLP